MEEKALQLAMRSLEIESKAIRDIGRYLDPLVVERAVDALCVAEKILLSGCGGSGIAAKKFSHSLCCAARSAFFLSPSEALHGGMGCIRGGDAVLLLSRGGKTAELLPLARRCRETGAALLVVTEYDSSPLALLADIVLPIRVEQETDRYDVMTTTSFIVAAALFDVLLVGVMEQSGYRLEQFAPIHPGGAVGERLNPMER